jgi:hypothetical protein
VQALDVSAPWQLLGNLLPVFASMLSYGLGEVLVLNSRSYEKLSYERLALS